MYKFEKDRDFSFLKGATLTQIVVNKFQLSLVFSEGHRIVVEHGLEYVRRSSQERHSHTSPFDTTPIFFHELLEARVATVLMEDLSLTMKFESGPVIRILTDEGQYESGHIAGPEGLYVF